MRLPLSILLPMVLFVTIESFPLDSVLARSDSSVNVIWTPGPDNVRTGWYLRCCTSDTNYYHSDFIAGTEYHGEAYSFGGEDPWDLFSARIQSGALAGSHDCHYYTCGDPGDSVTGTDCSGFLCYVWNVPRITTTGLATTYPSIRREDLRPGDALIKKSLHAILVIEADLPELLIHESYGWPVNGCRERIINLEDPYWDAYTAIRNPHLDGSSAITAGHITPRAGMKTGSVLFSLDGRRIAAGHPPRHSGLFIVPGNRPHVLFVAQEHGR